MKNIKYNLILLALIIFFALPPTSLAQQDPGDPWLADTVLFGGVCYYLDGPPYSGKIRVPIVFFNDEELRDITVPLVWSGPVVLDSASYAGSRVGEWESKVLEIDSVNNKVLLAGVTFSKAVPPGRGLFSTLYFSISDTGYLDIDTAFYPPSNILIFDDEHLMTWTPQFVKLQFDISPYTSGDVNQDGGVDIVDVVFLINYLFRSGPSPPCSSDCADVNCDWKIDITDVIYLINYLFKSGDPPYMGCHSAS